VNENLKPIGKILDIFGPISSPYASVKPKIQEIGKFADKMLYVLPSKRRKGKI
jgi:rRNA processing protein Gar1